MKIKLNYKNMKNIMNNKIKIFGAIAFALVVLVAPSRSFAIGCSSTNGPEGYNDWLQDQFWCIDGSGDNGNGNGNGDH